VIRLGDRKYRVRGLAKNLSYDVLRVNILAAKGATFHVDTFDLYSARQRALFVRQAAEDLALTEEVIKADVGNDPRSRTAIRLGDEMWMSFPLAGASYPDNTGSDALERTEVAVDDGSGYEVTHTMGEGRAVRPRYRPRALRGTRLRSDDWTVDRKGSDWVQRTQRHGTLLLRSMRLGSTASLAATPSTSHLTSPQRQLERIMWSSSGPRSSVPVPRFRSSVSGLLSCRVNEPLDPPGATRGSCLCGSVTFVVEGEPLRAHNCHCSRCRKGRSAAFASNLFTKADGVRFTRVEELLASYKIPEAKHFTQVFSCTCGSIMPRISVDRDLAIVPMGSLDDNPGMRPQAHIFVASKAPWFEITGNLP
jgi:hypothetical protein